MKNNTEKKHERKNRFTGESIMLTAEEAKRTTKQKLELIKERKFHILFTLTLIKIITDVLQVIGK